MNEEKLLAEAQALVGGDDALLAAGVFQPRGTQAGMTGGAAVGGGLAQGVAGLAATAAGIAIGQRAGNAAAHSQQVPRWTVLAVSPSRIYAFTGQGEGLAIRPVKLFAALDRARITTRVHQRIGVQVLELIDEDTGDTLELETARLGRWHGTDVLKQLG